MLVFCVCMKVACVWPAHVDLAFAPIPLSDIGWDHGCVIKGQSTLDLLAHYYCCSCNASAFSVEPDVLVVDTSGAPTL
eukprot:357867-Pelagomonas_calceolata.AAC.1